MEGLDIGYVNNKFGIQYGKKLAELCTKFEFKQQIIHQNNTLILTRQGKLFADGIASELFF